LEGDNEEENQVYDLKLPYKELDAYDKTLEISGYVSVF